MHPIIEEDWHIPVVPISCFENENDLGGALY